MSDSILDIESCMDKIEAMVKTLRGERDAAIAEAESMRRALDERETEFLQIDDELQKIKREGEDKLAAERKERENLENRLAEVASKLKNLMPLVMNHSDEAQSAPESPFDSI